MSEKDLTVLANKYKLNTVLQVHRGYFSDTYILLPGEPGYHLDTHEFKIGDGETPWGSLPLANEYEFGFDDGVEIPGDETLPAALKASLDSLKESEGWAEKTTAEKEAAMKTEVNNFYAAQKYLDENYGSRLLIKHAGKDKPAVESIRIGGQTVYSAKKELLGDVDDTITLDDKDKNGTEQVISYVQPTMHGIKNYAVDNTIFKTDRLTTNTALGIENNSDLNNLTTHEILKRMLYPPIRHSVSIGSIYHSATSNLINTGTRSDTSSGTYQIGILKTITKLSFTVTRGSEPVHSIAVYLGGKGNTGSTNQIVQLDVEEVGTTVKITPHIRLSENATDFTDIASFQVSTKDDKNSSHTDTSYSITLDLFKWLTDNIDTTKAGTGWWTDNLWKKLHINGMSTADYFTVVVESNTSDSILDSKLKGSGNKQISSDIAFIKPYYYGSALEKFVAEDSTTLSLDSWIPNVDENENDYGALIREICSKKSNEFSYLFSIPQFSRFVLAYYKDHGVLSTIKDGSTNTDASTSFTRLSVKNKLSTEAIKIKDSKVKINTSYTEYFYYMYIYNKGIDKVGGVKNYKFIFKH